MDQYSIVIPYSLLTYATLKRTAEGLSPQYGKWLALFLLTFIFNGLTLFKSNFVMFLDLALKISLFFLPEPMNEQLERQINHLHLEGVIETFRCKSINTLFKLHSKTTLLIVNKLREEEGQQFKEGLIACLNSSKQQPSIEVKSKVKELEHTAVNCTLITPTSIDAVETKLTFLQQKKEELERKIQEDRKSSKPKYQAQRQSSAPQKDQKDKPRKNHRIVTNTMYKTLQTGFKNRPAGDLQESQSMKNIRQSSEFLPDDFEDEHTEKPKPSPVRQSRLIDSKISEIRRPAAKNEQTGITRRNTDIEGLKIDKIVSSRQRSLSPDTQSIRDQAQILQKLDLSVSEYSDLFDDEQRDDDIDQDEQEVIKPVCKVEAIVQIGTAPNARLQIYNLELFSNGDLRIVSLYDRQFEKHHLVSMKKVLNNYYELTLSGGSVNKRKIKFRGQHQPFMKYAVSN